MKSKFTRIDWSIVYVFSLFLGNFLTNDWGPGRALPVTWDVVVLWSLRVLVRSSIYIHLGHCSFQFFCCLVCLLISVSVLYTNEFMARARSSFAVRRICCLMYAWLIARKHMVINYFRRWADRKPSWAFHFISSEVCRSLYIMSAFNFEGSVCACFINIFLSASSPFLHYFAFNYLYCLNM